MIRDTELRLSAWRDGSTQAERLATAVLRLSGYEEVDPQAPIGGPDGGKDILCSKGGITWVCAVYFPPTAVGFPAIKKKFNTDLAKCPGEHRGFVFVTNRPLTPEQRKTLKAAGTGLGKEVDIFNLERLRALLDAPSGYGARLQFLHIPMTTEEQLSWFEESSGRVSQALTLNTRELQSIKSLIQRLAKDSADIVRTMSHLGATPVATPDLLSTTNFSSSDSYKTISANIDISLILLTHRLVCFDLPESAVGVLRNAVVWLAEPSGNRADHLQPPDANLVSEQLEQLCAEWRDTLPKLARSNINTRLEALAKFHARLLVIHPFLDGNGRVARALLMQQCLDLFGSANMSLLEQGTTYYRALASADKGDPSALVELLKPVAGL